MIFSASEKSLFQVAKKSYFFGTPKIAFSCRHETDFWSPKNRFLREPLKGNFFGYSKISFSGR